MYLTAIEDLWVFEIREEKRREEKTHILCLDMQLETQVFLMDGSVWMVVLWRSHTPLCALSLLRHRSVSTDIHTHKNNFHKQNN